MYDRFKSMEYPIEIFINYSLRMYHDRNRNKKNCRLSITLANYCVCLSVDKHQAKAGLGQTVTAEAESVVSLSSIRGKTRSRARGQNLRNANRFGLIMNNNGRSEMCELNIQNKWTERTQIVFLD